ncbi:hypothetical protein ADIS_1101 [Lunatimonas lonarensis]|uniref:Uncharacterized protein n=1 Tax=Lunatimonas lonarensis TaxID=1232681 RepID=R7ZW83_9BACT|nr:hypothetical protein ADIS_1101 [Lunatimonas lonarensis]
MTDIRRVKRLLGGLVGWYWFHGYLQDCFLEDLMDIFGVWA